MFQGKQRFQSAFNDFSVGLKAISTMFMHGAGTLSRTPASIARQAANGSVGLKPSSTFVGDAHLLGSRLSLLVMDDYPERASSSGFDAHSLGGDKLSELQRGILSRVGNLCRVELELVSFEMKILMRRLREAFPYRQSVKTDYWNIGMVTYKGWTVEIMPVGSHKYLQLRHSVDLQSASEVDDGNVDADFVGVDGLFHPAERDSVMTFVGAILSAVFSIPNSTFLPDIVMLVRARDWLDVVVVLWDVLVKLGVSFVDDVISFMSESVERAFGSVVELQSVSEDMWRQVSSFMSTMNSRRVVAMVTSLVASERVKAFYVLMRSFLSSVIGYKIGFSYEDIQRLANTAVTQDPDTLPGALVSIMGTISDMFDSGISSLFSTDSAGSGLVVDTIDILSTVRLPHAGRAGEIKARLNRLESLLSQWGNAASVSTAHRSSAFLYIPQLKEAQRSLQVMLGQAEKIPARFVMLVGEASVGKSTLVPNISNAIQRGVRMALNEDLDAPYERAFDFPLGQKYYSALGLADPLVTRSEDDINAGSGTSLAEQVSAVNDFVYKLAETQPPYVPSAFVKEQRLYSIQAHIATFNERASNCLLAFPSDVLAQVRRLVQIRVSVKQQYATIGGSLDIDKLDGSEDYWVFNLVAYIGARRFEQTYSSAGVFYLDVAQLFCDITRNYLESLERARLPTCHMCFMREDSCVCDEEIELQAWSPREQWYGIRNACYRKIEQFQDLREVLGLGPTLDLASRYVVARVFVTTGIHVDSPSYHWLVAALFVSLFVSAPFALALLAAGCLRRRGTGMIVPDHWYLLPLGLLSGLMFWRTFVKPKIDVVQPVLVAAQGGLLSKVRGEKGEFVHIPPVPERESGHEILHPKPIFRSAVCAELRTVSFEPANKQARKESAFTTYGFGLNGSLIIPYHTLHSRSGRYLLTVRNYTKPQRVERKYVNITSVVKIGHDLGMVPNFVHTPLFATGGDCATHLLTLSVENEPYLLPVTTHGPSVVTYPGGDRVEVIQTSTQAQGMCGLVYVNLDTSCVVGVHVAGHPTKDIGYMQSLDGFGVHGQTFDYTRYMPPSPDAPIAAMPETRHVYLGTKSNQGTSIRTSKAYVSPDAQVLANELDIWLPEKVNGKYDSENKSYTTRLTPWLRPRPLPAIALGRGGQEVLSLLRSEVRYDVFSHDGPLSLHESLNTFVFNDEWQLPKIDVKTSGGFGVPDKMALLEREADGTLVPSEELIVLYTDMLLDLAHGPISLEINAAGKDEPVTASKVALAKYRTFFIMPFVFNLIVRAYFGPMITAIKAMRFFGIGMNVFQDWDEFARDFEDGQCDLACGDFSGFDLSLSSGVVDDVYHRIVLPLATSLIGQQHESICYNILESLRSGYVYGGGDAYFFSDVLFSGSPLTTTINSIVVLYLVTMTRLDRGLSVHGVKTKIFGDDSVVKLEKGLTMDDIARVSRDFGYNYTSSDKSDVLKPVSIVEFLRRATVDHPDIGKKVGALERRSIYKSALVYDLKSPLTRSEREVIIARNFCLESALHGEETFSEMVSTLCKVYPPYNKHLWSYADCVSYYKADQYTGALFADYVRISGRNDADSLLVT